MRYAREQNDGGLIRLIDTVDVPADITDASAWLAQNRPGITGYVLVDPANVVGAVKQGNGTYLNPTPISAPLSPIVFDAAGFSVFICGLLDPDPLVGRSKLRQILEAAAAKTGALPSDLRTRDFKDWFYATRAFDKATVSSYLADLVTSAIITTNQKNAVVNGWPNG